MFFYVSVRPINTNGKRMLTPKYALRDSFPGLVLSWRSIVSATKEDGRWLYEIETDTIEHRDVILEGLQMWGCHLKDEIKTIKLFCKLARRCDSSFKDGRLHIPEVDKIMEVNINESK